MMKECLCFVLSLAMISCGSDAKSAQDASKEDSVRIADSLAAEDLKTSRVFTVEGVEKQSLRIVISKKDLTLTVYGKQDSADVRVARYPICLSRNKGQKTTNGDMCTPESEPGQPFTITEIKPASTWVHDFGDGRGPIKAYGDWFMRLSYGKGIGIHGSTGNEWSIPGSMQVAPAGRTQGRDSEGCIRLKDEDIIHLKENYASVGMQVVIKREGQDLLEWEKAVANLSDPGTLIR